MAKLMTSTKEGQRTILGFDFGTKRIGIAIGQEVTGTTNPLMTIKAIKNKPDWDRISKIIEEWQPDLFVVGLPLHMDGSEQDMTQAARRFSNQLNGRYQLPVELVDERLSSDEAESIIKEQYRSLGDSIFPDKAQVDMISAQLILQSWMASRSTTATPKNG